MYVCLCMYICIYVCVCVCMYICIYICIHVYVYVCCVLKFSTWSNFYWFLNFSLFAFASKGFSPSIVNITYI